MEPMASSVGEGGDSRKERAAVAAQVMRSEHLLSLDLSSFDAPLPSLVVMAYDASGGNQGLTPFMMDVQRRARPAEPERLAVTRAAPNARPVCDWALNVDMMSHVRQSKYQRWAFTAAADAATTTAATT